MNFTVLTIFPELLDAFWENGIIRRAVQSGAIAAEAVNIRDFAADRHQMTDDRPYGGGCGMVMKPEPLAAAIGDARTRHPAAPVVLMSPQGRRFDQDMARELAAKDDLILVCGRYEGIDERVAETRVDLEVSIGDYVMTGGELAAMVIMDAVTRLIPGALGNEDSAQQDSFSDRRLDCAHYTRPPEFEGQKVPDVLLSGDHGRIARWRAENALAQTLLKRPDLLGPETLTADDRRILENWRREIERITGTPGLRGPGASPGGQ